MAAVGDGWRGNYLQSMNSAEATVAEDVVLDITEAASVSIEGKLINHGIWRFKRRRRSIQGPL